MFGDFGCLVPPDRMTKVVGRFVVKTNGAILDGVDFSAAYVDVQADAVTIRNCRFGAEGWYTVRQYQGRRGLVVERCTFDGGRTGKGAGTAVWGGDGQVTVLHCDFRNLPSDCVKLSWGEIADCRMTSLGWATGAHAAFRIVACNRP